MRWFICRPREGEVIAKKELMLVLPLPSRDALALVTEENTPNRRPKLHAQGSIPTIDKPCSKSITPPSTKPHIYSVARLIVIPSQ